MRRSAGGVDVYLLPAIVGGGLGDIEEVLCAGRRLVRAGFSLTLYRRAGRPWPGSVDGPWDWPPLTRRSRLRPGNARALTVAPAWGVVAAPARNEPFGRAGPWAEEAAEIERTYGPERTVHVSLEEFARTLTARDETAERLREGGVRSRDRSAAREAAERHGEVDAFRRAYRTFRAFDRPNVLAVFASFRYDRPFAREYPEAVQTGPLWPGRGPGHPVVGSRRRWVWYASPASATAIAPGVFAGLRRARPAPSLLVRSPRPWPGIVPPRGVELRSEPVPPATWRREFRQAGVRIVTGSRTLLEALERGGPFLYFNGVLGAGRARRRHRPEKIVELLALARRSGWPESLVDDLDAFSRGRRVAEVVARAASARDVWSRFPPAPVPTGFPAGFDDAGAVIVRLARELAEPSSGATELVEAFRRASTR